MLEGYERASPAGAYALAAGLVIPVARLLCFRPAIGQAADSHYDDVR